MPVTISVDDATMQRRLGAPEIVVEATTLREAIRQADIAHPGFASDLLTEGGGIRDSLDILVGGLNIFYLQGIETPTPAGTTISIVREMVGG